MKKADCEKFIRALCHQWARGLSDDELKHPSFLSFKAWLSSNGFSHYLNFRAVPSPDYVAEMWFDQELKQTGRN